MILYAFIIGSASVIWVFGFVFGYWVGYGLRALKRDQP